MLAHLIGIMFQSEHIVRKNVLVLVRVRVTLRLAVYGQSFRLGDKPLETHDK
jgi:hypothetical protein